MKEAYDLKSKAKDKRRLRRENDRNYKDPDRINFKNQADYNRHVKIESKEEEAVERSAAKGMYNARS